MGADRMTIGESVVKLLQLKGYGIPGQDIFLHRVPNSKQVGEEVYWVTYSGGTPIRINPTGERHLAYLVTVNFRSMNAKTVDDKLAKLTDMFNCLECSPLEGFTVVTIQTNNFNVRQDLDAEERMYGYIQIQVVVQKTCN